MRKIIVLMGIFLFVSSLSARDKVQSFFVENDLEINGDLSEWTGRQLNNFEDRQISVGVRNDNDNLYLLLATRNKQSMRILETSGVTVWINGKDKTKKNFGLNFVTESGMDSLIFDAGIAGNRMSPDGMNQPEIMAKRDENREQMRKHKSGVVIVKNGEKDEDIISEVSSDGSSGIIIKSGMYKDVYLVEMKIPLKSDDPTALVVPEFKKEKLAVGLEWNFNPFDNRPKPPEGMGGGRGGGMGGGRPGDGPPGGMGGGMGGGRPGGGPPGGGMRQQMNSEAYKDFWFTVKLAEK